MASTWSVVDGENDDDDDDDVDERPTDGGEIDSEICIQQRVSSYAALELLMMILFLGGPDCERIASALLHHPKMSVSPFGRVVDTAHGQASAAVATCGGHSAAAEWSEGRGA